MEITLLGYFCFYKKWDKSRSRIRVQEACRTPTPPPPRIFQEYRCSGHPTTPIYTLPFHRSKSLFNVFIYNQWQMSWDGLCFPYLAVMVIAFPSPPPPPQYNIELYPSNLAAIFQHNLEERGVCKIKYEVLKSKDFIMEHYFIQCPKYFCH